MRYPWANTLLLLLLLGQLLTGLGGLLSGGDNFSGVLWLHGLGGYALAVLLYWKGVIIFHVFKRRWRWTVERLAFIGLTLLVLAILVTGWLWSYLGPLYLGGMSLIWPKGTIAAKTIVTGVYVIAIEIFQLTPIPLQLSRSNNLAIRLFAYAVLGSRFSGWDLLAYGVGVTAMVGVEKLYFDSDLPYPPADPPQVGEEMRL